MTLARSFLGTARDWFARHRRLAWAFIILYVLWPVDLVPEALVGPVGLLDDLFMMLLPLLLRRKKTPTPEGRPERI